MEDRRPWYMRDGDLWENWLDMMMPTIGRDDPLRSKMGHVDKPSFDTREIQRLQRIAELAKIVIEPMYFYVGDEFNAYQIGWPSDEVEAAVKELRELLGIVYE